MARCAILTVWASRQMLLPRCLPRAGPSSRISRYNQACAHMCMYGVLAYLWIYPMFYVSQRRSHMHEFHDRDINRVSHRVCHSTLPSGGRDQGPGTACIIVDTGAQHSPALRRSVLAPYSL